MIEERDLQIYLTHKDRVQRWEIADWRDFSFQHGRLPIGPGSVTFPADAPWLPTDALVAAEGQECNEFSITARFRGSTKWDGPVLKVRLSHKGSSAGAMVTLYGETFFSHFLRRRLNFSTDHDAVEETDNAENLVLTFMRRGYGTIAWAIAGYPGGVVRTDFGSFTMAVEAAHGGPASPNTTAGEQSGNNLRALVETFCFDHDLYAWADESPAQTFTFKSDFPYQENDYSDSIIFATNRGNMLGTTTDIDRTPLSNVVRMQGDGAQAAQNASWDSDAGSITLFGVIENAATIEDGTAVMAAIDKAALMQADPIRTYAVPLIETPGHEFVTDFGVRDLIALEDSVFGRASVDKLIVGYKLVGQGGRVTIGVTLGEHNYDGVSYMAGRTGFIGGYGTGTKWRGNNG